jgi:hypothetical protein
MTTNLTEFSIFFKKLNFCNGTTLVNLTKKGSFLRNVKNLAYHVAQVMSYKQNKSPNKRNKNYSILKFSTIST